MTGAAWEPPALGKWPPDERRENLPVPWSFFLGLRAWCRWVAVQTGAHAYLVGSALEKDPPRDVDVALIWPDAEYESHFGAIPASDDEYAEWLEGPIRYARHAFTVSAWEGVAYRPRIDVHLCPERWYRDRPRLLLGSPADPDPPASAGAEDFLLRNIVGHGTEDVLFEWPTRREGCA